MSKLNAGIPKSITDYLSQKFPVEFIVYEKPSQQDACGWSTPPISADDPEYFVASISPFEIPTEDPNINQVKVFRSRYSIIK